MKPNDSKPPSLKQESRPALTLVAYGIATAEVALATIAARFRKSLAAAARSNSSARDASPICKGPRERFVWVHGFLSGCALGTGVFTIGLCIALWISI